MGVVLSIGLDTQQTFAVRRPKFSSEKFSCVISLMISSCLFSLTSLLIELLLHRPSQIYPLVAFPLSSFIHILVLFS